MKRLFIHLFNLLLPISAYCQLTETFEIKLSKRKYPNALYNRIQFIESRTDSNYFGFLLVGRKNVNTAVSMNKNLNQILPNILNALIDSTAKNDTLLFSLDEMVFSETTKYDKDNATFKLKACIFCKKGKKSYPIHKIDTSITANFEGDMSYMIMVKASNLINNEIASSLNKAIIENDFVWTYTILKKDSLNKSKLPLYTLDTLKNGLYRDYNTFKMQQPNSVCEVIRNKDTIIKVIVNGKVIEPEDAVYAIVTENKAYLKVNGHFIKMYKRQFDLFFSMNEDLIYQSNSINGVPLFLPIGVGTGINAAGNAAAGLIGGLIINAIINNKREKEDEFINIITYKINYKNGESMFFKKDAYYK